jgi:tetratricopeptide (TPR) repeat protein
MVNDDADKARVERLLEQILESGDSPEEVCRACPELLEEVRAAVRQLRQLEEDVSGLFPPSTDGESSPPGLLLPVELPAVPGYEVLGILGHGGMGVVFRARQLRLNRPVALKMILAGPYANPDERRRFVQEAEAVASLHHSNIVQVYDAGEIDGRPYFTMELVEGGRLSEKVNGKPLPAREAAAMMVAVANAVHAAHERGIVHRDLTPSNILLASDGTPKVTDFGLARRLELNPEMTLTGAPVGTPSYMAPEQARGEKRAIGPATDVYGLGAILYDLLTGRPPFQAESATATLQQVVSGEPVPPARLNARVPRDLETICLKCLHKDPRRRYASAAALADDLRRFEKGEPITARPTGPLERGVRWVRRRPALATALAAGLLLASALAAAALWWHGQRTALKASAVAYAEADLRESAQLRDKGEFKASAAVLRRARDRLREFVPPELRGRLSTAFDNLELITRLEAIRVERALIKPQGQHGAEQILSVTPAPDDDPRLSTVTAPERRYEEAFRDAGAGAPGDEPDQVAARVRASAVYAGLVAALDDWAVCATDRDQQAWVLAVLRRADPDPWRDRVRDPATWDNPAALRDLADRANVVEQSSQLLAVLGAHLRAKNLDAVAFLARVVSAYPGDFWANIEMGNALSQRPNPMEAVGYYRTALALRPQSVTLHYALGGLYLGQHRWDECIAEFEQALRLAPENAWCHNRLGFALAWSGREAEAVAQFREAIRLDGNNGWSHYFLAVALERKGNLDEAVVEFREAARLVLEKRAQWKRDMRKVLLRLGRGAEARAAWKEELAAHPPAHDDWFGYAELCLFLGDEEEYRRARRELLAQFGTVSDRDVAERVGRACLLLPVPEDELGPAVVLFERALAGGRLAHDGGYPYFRFTEGLARYRQGRFDDAISLMNGDAASVLGPSPRLVLAMAQYQKGQKDPARKTLAAAVLSYDWSTAKADNHESWIAHILRHEAESLIRPRPQANASTSPASIAPVRSK